MTPHLAALTHEPLGALTPGGDGLADLAHLAATAPTHLHPGGWLLLEHGWDQAEAAAPAGTSRFCQRTQPDRLRRAAPLHRRALAGLRAPSDPHHSRRFARTG